MAISQVRVDYNLKHENIRDISPETIADISGKLQSDHNRDNEIARIKLDQLGRRVNDNIAKISELEKLTIKQQTEIDFIKSTPTNFDLADTEHFFNRFGTLRTVAPDGVPEAEILTDTYAARSDGNFEIGLLKNPRSKMLGGVERVVNIASLFGAEKHDISYGETTNSLWILTSDGPGERGYLFRCSPNFIDGQLNVLSFWILDALGGDLQHYGICENTFNGITTLFIGVSDETGSGHFICRYRLRYNESENIVTIADGKESSPLVPIYKGKGEILDSDVSSSIADLGVERVDISEPGVMRGLEAVNQYLYMVIQNDTNDSEEEIDNIGYSFIRRVLITDAGVLASSINSVKYKLDDITEESTNGANTTTSNNVFGIAAYRLTTPLQAFSNVDSANITNAFNNDDNTKYFYLSLQHKTTNAKRIALINLKDSEVSIADPNFNIGFARINTLVSEFMGFNIDEETQPFITTLLDRTLLEVNQTTNGSQNLIAIHDLNGYDLFQGNIDYTAKVKRYFPTEQFHGQLGVIVNGITVNNQAAVTAGPDNSFFFTTGAGNRTRNTLTSPPQFATGNILHYHTYLSGSPFWARPSFTFAVTDGVTSPVSGIASIAWKGTQTSGEALYVAYLNSTQQNALMEVDGNDIITTNPQLGADGFSQYEILTGSIVTPTAGNLGSFNGSVAYDPITEKLWVSTSLGFIHNITDGGNTLDFSQGDSFSVLKVYGTTSTSGNITDGSTIVGLSVFNNTAYVAASVPDNNLNASPNTIVRVFDIDRSTSTQPLSTSIFVVKGKVEDISVSDNGMFVARGLSTIEKVYTSQTDNNIFESTEVLDEFNFFKNPVVTTGSAGQLGFDVDAVALMRKNKSSDSFQKREWIIPRRSIIAGIHTDFSNTLYAGKLQIIDYADVDNPVLWSEFNIAKGTFNPVNIGSSGSLLVGSGQIDAITSVDDKIFVARNTSGFGVSVNVIDFANDIATIIVDPVSGQGNIYSGMQFGFKEAETDKTGGLNERNNPDYHYSGFVNPKIKVGPGRITSMHAAMVTNKTDQNVLTPYVVVGHTQPTGAGASGALTVINGNTFESVIGVGPGRGTVKKVHINSDGSAFAALDSGIFYKIEDVRLVQSDQADYVTDFLAQRVDAWYPDSSSADSLSDFKVQNFIDTLGRSRNIIYAAFNEGSGNPTMAVKFEYEIVADAGGGVSNASEFLNNAEVIYYTPTSQYGVTGIDYMDNRIFLSFRDPTNGFRMAVLRKQDFQVEDDEYSNNWTPILGTNGVIDQYIDYNDLNYNGIKSEIKSIQAFQDISLLLANTKNGSVIFKFPFTASSRWFSTIKTIAQDINAVALSRDVVIADSFVSEFIDRTDERITFEGSWQDQNAAVTLPFTSDLFNKSDGKKKMRGKLVDAGGFPFKTSDYVNFQPFAVAPENGIDLFFNGSGVTNFGYDFADNILMIQRDDNIQSYDFIDVAPGDIKYKPIYDAGKQLATISLNEQDTAVSFFINRIASLTNDTSDAFQTTSVEFNISQNPAIAIYTLDGRPIATVQEASATGEIGDADESDLVKSDVASTQKLVTDPDGNPVSSVVLTGRKARNEGKTTVKVTLKTFDFKITERL